MKFVISFYFCVILLLLLPPSAIAAIFIGRVLGITDDDTITVMHHGHGEKIRLSGSTHRIAVRSSERASGLFLTVVTARKSQCWPKAKTAINALSETPDGRNLGHEIVKAGFARWFRRYAPRNSVLEKMESEAREGRRGRWSFGDPMLPWEWRKAKATPNTVLL